ncbi:MAG TPA: phosphohistidine phosphatase SixA [Opitutaceae bacterium]|nr:phosphohistidine phosphatase SixA [Opitutaceae bacterium]
MRLYLIRHAHAVDAEEDADRPLSTKGREQVKRLADFLRESETLQPEEIWHSPLRRSKQTAKLLAKRLKLPAPLIEVEGLEPEDDVRTTALRVKNLRKVVAIVGHEPHLSALASQLIASTPKTSAFVLRKSSVLALERDRGGRGSRWVVRWQVSPELLR